MALMEHRARDCSIQLIPPLFPHHLRAYVARHDPVSVPHTKESKTNPFLGKYILVLSGAADVLVPWECSRPFVDALNVGASGVKQIIVLDGIGHQLTPEMHTHTATFVLRWLMRARSL